MRAWRHPTATVRQVADRMHFAAGKAVGVARLVELVRAAGEAKDLWEEAFNVAVEARQYADVMQDAAEKAEDLTQVAQAGSSCVRFDCVGHGFEQRPKGKTPQVDMRIPHV